MPLLTIFFLVYVDNEDFHSRELSLRIHTLCEKSQMRTVNETTGLLLHLKVSVFTPKSIWI